MHVGISFQALNFRLAMLLQIDMFSKSEGNSMKELAPFLPLFEDDPSPDIGVTVNDLLKGVEDVDQRRELKSLTSIIASRFFAREINEQWREQSLLLDMST